MPTTNTNKAKPATSKRAIKAKPAATTANKRTASKRKATGEAVKPSLTFDNGNRGSYAGSPNFRGHGKTLSPVATNKPVGHATDRDTHFVNDLKRVFGNKPFQRNDIDAGSLGRAISHGFVKYVSGGTKAGNAISGRDAQFQLTSKA